MAEIENWISMNDACEYLGISRDTLKKMVLHNGLPAYKIDRQWKFKISEIDVWMHEQNKILSKEGEMDV